MHWRNSPTGEGDLLQPDRRFGAELPCQGSIAICPLWTQFLRDPLEYTGSLSRESVPMQLPDFRKIANAGCETLTAGRHTKSFTEHLVLLLNLFGFALLCSAP